MLSGSNTSYHSIIEHIYWQIQEFKSFLIIIPHTEQLHEQIDFQIVSGRTWLQIKIF